MQVACPGPGFTRAQIEPAHGANQNIQDGAVPKVTRESAAEAAGISEWQRKTALRRLQPSPRNAPRIRHQRLKLGRDHGIRAGDPAPVLAARDAKRALSVLLRPLTLRRPLLPEQQLDQHVGRHVTADDRALGNIEQVGDQLAAWWIIRVAKAESLEGERLAAGESMASVFKAEGVVLALAAWLEVLPRTCGTEKAGAGVWMVVHGGLQSGGGVAGFSVRQLGLKLHFKLH